MTPIPLPTRRSIGATPNMTPIPLPTRRSIVENAAAREGDAAAAPEGDAAAHEGTGGPATVTTAGRLWVEGGTAPPAAAKRAALSRKPPSTLDALTRPAVSHGSLIGTISTSNASSPAGATAARAAGAKAAGAIGPELHADCH